MPMAMCPATSPRPAPLCGALPQPSPAPSQGPPLVSPALGGGGQHHPGCAWHWGGTGDARGASEGKNETTWGLRRNCHLQLSHSLQRASGTGALEGTQLKIALGGRPATGNVPRQDRAGAQGPSCHGLAVRSTQARGLEAQPGGPSGTAPQQGTPKCRLFPQP